MRRSTSPRCRTPPSGRIVLRVEGRKATSSRFPDGKTLDLRGLLQKMLHGMARLRLVEEEGYLPFIEAELRGEVDPQLLVPGEQRSDRREEIGADNRLGNMQQLRQFLRDGVAGSSLGAGPRHLDQVIRELELASPGAPFAGDGDAARHHLARVRPEAISYAVFCLKKKKTPCTVASDSQCSS